MGFLQNHRLQILLTLLLCLDIVIVVAELFVDAEWPDCRIIERDSVSCCPAPQGFIPAHSGSSGSFDFGSPFSGSSSSSHDSGSSSSSLGLFASPTAGSSGHGRLLSSSSGSSSSHEL